MSTDQDGVWDREYLANESYFGDAPSLFCIRAVDSFSQQKVSTLLELGAGQGRDTKYFVEKGFSMIAVDFSDVSCAQLRQRFGDKISVVKKDLRKGIDLPAASVDGCYAHMLLTMDFTDDELKRLVNDVYKSLVPGGVFTFSVRNVNDSDYGTGTEIRENVYQNGKGFNVRFFSKDEILSYVQQFELLRMNEFSEGKKVLYAIAVKKPK